MLKTQSARGRKSRQLDAGPVAAHLDFLASSLHEQRYTADTIRKHVYGARAFVRWLAQNQRTIADANETTVSVYIAELRRTCERSSVVRKTVSALPHFLSAIRAQGVCTEPVVESPPTGASQWLVNFDGHLSQVLGLAPASRKRYCFFVRRFLDTFCGVETPDWSLLRAEHLTAFIHQEISRRNGHARKSPITAIRALLRYLTCKGDIRNGLEAAIPMMPQWKHAALPKHLAVEEVERIVASALDDASQGLRNHAILLLGVFVLSMHNPEIGVMYLMPSKL